jgi:hypothetical protein
MTNPKHNETRLLRRITHLRTMLRYTEENLIVNTLMEFITETEFDLAALKTGLSGNITEH